jgi:two-component system response regulator MprA
VVEDDPDTLASVEDVLAEAGYRVTGASSAPKALALLAKGYLPAAMLVDFRMPELTGLQFLEACRAHPALAGIPGIVMSADVPADLVAQGVRWILKKPFSVDAVIAMVATAISSRPGVVGQPRAFS